MPRRWSSVVNIAVLAIQLGVSAIGTIGMCVDRPHTHGGVPAPDCLMHQEQPADTTQPASSHGHHHDSSTSTDGARISCSCASDPLTLVATEVGVLASAAVTLPDLVALPSPYQPQSAPDVRLAPLSPPPRA
jgi:hypothetical protein